jgi:hypothetical protein
MIACMSPCWVEYPGGDGPGPWGNDGTAGLLEGGVKELVPTPPRPAVLAPPDGIWGCAPQSLPVP